MSEDIRQVKAWAKYAEAEEANAMLTDLFPAIKRAYMAGYSDGMGRGDADIGNYENELAAIRLELENALDRAKRLEGVLRLCIGMDTSTPWPDVRQEDIDGYCDEWERLNVLRLSGKPPFHSTAIIRLGPRGMSLNAGHGQEEG